MGGGPVPTHLQALVPGGPLRIHPSELRRERPIRSESIRTHPKVIDSTFLRTADTRTPEAILTSGRWRACRAMHCD